MSNHICDIMHWWWQESQNRKPKYGYETARNVALEVEKFALRYLTMDQLQACSIHAFRDYHECASPTKEEMDLHDAAITAMDAGSYNVAWDILTRDGRYVRARSVSAIVYQSRQRQKARSDELLALKR
jgi:hypothetical protein